MILKWFEKYQVLLILFIYLIGATGLYSIVSGGSPMTFLMGIFFISFSFFKVIHLKKFNESFSRYDILAKLIPFYGYVYPFIEIILGVLFLASWLVIEASVVTLIILTSTTFGVIQTLRKGNIVECACLGVVFNLPLSKVTIFENSVMILMALKQILS